MRGIFDVHIRPRITLWLLTKHDHLIFPWPLSTNPVSTSVTTGTNNILYLLQHKGRLLSLNTDENAGSGPTGAGWIVHPRQDLLCQGITVQPCPQELCFSSNAAFRKKMMSHLSHLHCDSSCLKLHRHRPQIEKVGTDGSQRGNQRLPWQGTAGSQTVQLRVPNLGTRGYHCKELPVPRS